MIVSEARIAANRENSKRSTGPTSPEGKSISRANSLKHGLCASAVVPEDLELIGQRSKEFFMTLKPQNELHVWNVEQASILSIRIERCQRIERRVRDKVSLRAELTWDDDRRFEVEVLARSLAKDPASTVEALRRSPHGCEWLMGRWAMLAYSADTQPGGWTPDQTRLAFDLLATPPLFREGRKPGVVIDGEGRLVDNADDSAAVARREIAALKERRDVVANLDEVDRHLASSDLTNEGDPELRRLRRYESALHGRMRWNLKQITIQSPYRCPDPGLRPRWVASLDEPIPEFEPETAQVAAAEACQPEAVAPPDDLEPDEPLEAEGEVEVPVILNARREKKLRKAEARREGRRRKVDKLRA